MFSARVIQIFIASPSDLPEEREAIRSALADWNALNAEGANLVLLPRAWETHSTPNLNRPAQDSINVEVLKQADMAVCCFWTKLGSPTAGYSSGTVEEIEQLISEGKPVLLYFSDRPVVPGSVDPGQFSSVMAFKSSAFKRGLCGSFDSPTSLRALLMDDLTRAVRKLQPRTQSEGASSEVLHGWDRESLGTRDELVGSAKRLFAKTAFELVAKWNSFTPETWMNRRWSETETLWDFLGTSVGNLASAFGFDDPLVRYLSDELKWFRDKLDGDLVDVRSYREPESDADLPSICGQMSNFVLRGRLLAELDWLAIS